MTQPDSVPKLRGAFEDRADAYGVLLRWRTPRRRSDVGLVYLRGPRSTVLRLPMDLLELSGEYDLEILRSEGDDQRYLLVLAVTESLDSQQPHSPERRAKLLRRLQEAG